MELSRAPVLDAPEPEVVDAPPPRRGVPRSLVSASELGWRFLVVVAAVDAVTAGIGLSLIGVPLAVPLATLIFFGAFVPTVGAIVTGVVAVLIALVTGGWVDALLVVALLVAARLTLLVALVVPIVGEAIRQVGPVVLASRPEFDDLMDGLTFGVISGVSYACFDTLVRHWDLLTGGLQAQDPGLWVSLIFPR